MQLISKSLDTLYKYCNVQNWVGYDPYDGLNSNILRSIPFIRDYWIFRLIFLQFNKKFPINLRPFLAINKGRNPKGIGLFLYGVSKLYKKTRKREYLSLINQLVDMLKKDISPGYCGLCWGYNFDWQSRAFFLPRGTPTVVNTSFIGRTFLYLYELFKCDEYYILLVAHVILY